MLASFGYNWSCLAVKWLVIPLVVFSALARVSVGGGGCNQRLWHAGAAGSLFSPTASRSLGKDNGIYTSLSWRAYGPWEALWQWKEGTSCGIWNAGQEFTAGVSSPLKCEQRERKRKNSNKIKLALGMVKLHT